MISHPAELIFMVWQNVLNGVNIISHVDAGKRFLQRNIQKRQGGC